MFRAFNYVTLFVAGCDLLDVLLTNDYLLIMTTEGVYVSNDMSDSSRVKGVRMMPLTYTRGFDPKELGCTSLPVSVVVNNRLYAFCFVCTCISKPSQK